MPTQTSGSPPEASTLRALASLVLGVGLIVVGVSGSSSQTNAAAPVHHVVVTARALPAGAPITAQDVAIRDSVESLPGGLASLDQAVGRRLAVTVGVGEPVQAAELAVSGSAPTPRRLVTIQVDPRVVPAGVASGDSVEVVRAGDDVHAAVVVGVARIVGLTPASAESPVTLITLDTDAATALAIAGLPGGATLRISGMSAS